MTLVASNPPRDEKLFSYFLDKELLNFHNYLAIIFRWMGVTRSRGSDQNARKRKPFVFNHGFFMDNLHSLIFGIL